jgi:hypothetical protein
MKKGGERVNHHNKTARLALYVAALSYIAVIVTVTATTWLR